MYFIAYRWRKFSHELLNGSEDRKVTKCTPWDHSQLCIQEHPVDYIRRMEAKYGYAAWRERGFPFGHLSDSAHWHEEYEIVFFAEVPEDVGRRALDAEWGL